MRVLNDLFVKGVPVGGGSSAPVVSGVRKTANQLFAHNSSARMEFAVSTAPWNDEQGWWDATNNWFVIPATGWYEAFTQVRWANMLTAGSVMSYIELWNAAGTSVLREVGRASSPNHGSGANLQYVQCQSFKFQAFAGQKVALVGYQNNSSAADRNAQSGLSNVFQLTRLS